MVSRARLGSAWFSLMFIVFARAKISSLRRIFPAISRIPQASNSRFARTGYLSRCSKSEDASTRSFLEGTDPIQAELMREECILVDESDRVLGHASKYDTHLMENIDAGKALHRAFSVFLFDSDGKLLLQQRANEKITFPDAWTNTCCSHPLYRPEEIEEDDHIGVRRAACRKLEHELGITEEFIKPEDIVFLTRILYKAPSNGIWGEHEVDYILFAQKDIRDIESKINKNEVGATEWVTQNDLRQILDSRTIGETNNVILTPWFRLIVESGLLFNWWDNLEDIMRTKVSPLPDEKNKIINMLEMATS
mmetsp:Transcript_10895/g.16250  ORF Transcript_10895/g.16250 Transcript_10895/m.16250 type:complete len:308 (+) Transcript_10895:1-924(+)